MHQEFHVCHGLIHLREKGACDDWANGWVSLSFLKDFFKCVDACAFFVHVCVHVCMCMYLCVPAYMYVYARMKLSESAYGGWRHSIAPSTGLTGSWLGVVSREC